MKDIEKLVLARAARQHAVFSAHQAVADGMTARQLQLQKEAGRLVSVHRGVYGLAAAPPTFQRFLMAACLATDGVASHRSAAALWELRGCASGRVEVTVRGRRQPELTGVMSHRTDRLDAVDVAERAGIPVTSPARTLFDLGAVVDVSTVEGAMGDAVFRGLVTVSWLQRTVDRLARRGRNGSAVLRDLLRYRDPRNQPTESELEDDLVRLFRRADLPEPERQYEVVGPGGRSVRLDLAYPDALLAIEASGRLWHSGRADFQRNTEKRNLLLALGWRVLEFTAYDIRGRPATVVDHVRRALELTRAS